MSIPIAVKWSSGNVREKPAFFYWNLYWHDCSSITWNNYEMVPESFKRNFLTFLLLESATFHVCLDTQNRNYIYKKSIVFYSLGWFNKNHKTVKQFMQSNSTHCRSILHQIVSKQAYILHQSTIDAAWCCLLTNVSSSIKWNVCLFGNCAQLNVRLSASRTNTCAAWKCRFFYWWLN